MNGADKNPNLNGMAAADPPIACSLTAADLGDREVEWRALLEGSLVGRERIPSGVRITVQPSATEELQRLVDLERDCCAWMQFKFDAPETVAITASAEGVDLLVSMFLADSVP